MFSFCIMLLTHQPAFEAKNIIQYIIRLLMLMLKLRISCSANSSIRFKYDQVLKIGLSILLGSFLQTAIVLVFCPSCSPFKFSLNLAYMASRRRLWSIAKNLNYEVA